LREIHPQNDHVVIKLYVVQFRNPSKISNMFSDNGNQWNFMKFSTLTLRYQQAKYEAFRNKLMFFKMFIEGGTMCSSFSMIFLLVSNKHHDELR
jgi:hypothetical protein